jgi:CRISPR/Cas system-associated protein Csm6
VTTAHLTGAEAPQRQTHAAKPPDRRTNMSENVSHTLKGAVERAKQSAEKQEDRRGAAGSEAEEVVHELAVKSGEKLAQERNHRAG